MKAAPQVPPYFDSLIDGFRRGQAGRCVHLGWWEPATQPPDDDFAGAQRRLDRRLIDAAALSDGLQVLDAGCGFGGTLESINAAFSGMLLAGVNVDPRQLQICGGLAPRNGNRLQWHEADACALPFAAESFDRVLCIEAMFHFASRRAFFSEAARVLKPGGALVGCDIALGPAGGLPGPEKGRIEATLRAAYGPWPDPWGGEGDHEALAAAARLHPRWLMDATAHTLPSHRFTAPAGDDDNGHNPARSAAIMLKRLHVQGVLRYRCFRFDKPLGP